MNISTLAIDRIPDEAARPEPDPGVPAAPAEAGLGALATERGNLPLRRIAVQAAITGLTAGIEITQGFHNPHDVPLEATYIFPLPDRAAVVGLTMTAGDRVIEGVLSERGAAREAYDAAIAAGRQAGIAEEERPDVFTLRVGNILPGEDVTVAFRLAGPLPFADGQAEFRLPLVVAPRYIPGRPLPGEPAGSGYADDTDAVPDASRITPPVLLPGFPNPVELSIETRIDPAGLTLTGLASSLHAIVGDEQVVRIRPGERVNRDFILRLAYQGAANSLIAVPDAEGDEGTYWLTVLPGTDAEADTGAAAGGATGPAGSARRRGKDLVLLLDRSGSMEGWKMVAARRAAARIVDTLTAEDRFAVLTFDHAVQSPPGLPEGLLAATERHRYRAVEHLARVEARGGTELAAPMLKALDLLVQPAQPEQAEQPVAAGDRGPDAARDRVLVLVTDGQVGGEDQLLQLLGARLAAIRVHTVGIDQAVNAGFLGRLAGLGGGRCELVESEERLDEAMARIHRRIGSPLVTDVRVEGAGLELVPGTASPARVPDLFPGVPLVLAGRYRISQQDTATVEAASGSAGEAGNTDEATIVVSGLTQDGAAWRAVVPAVRSERAEVAALWARGRLRDLEDRYAVSGGAALEQEIVETSLRHGVLCRFTAYTAIDQRVVTDGGAPHRVTQLVEQPAGWEPLADTASAVRSRVAGGFGGWVAASAQAAPAAPSAPAPAASYPPMQSPAPAGAAYGGGGYGAPYGAAPGAPYGPGGGYGGPGAGPGAGTAPEIGNASRRKASAKQTKAARQQKQDVAAAEPQAAPPVAPQGAWGPPVGGPAPSPMLPPSWAASVRETGAQLTAAIEQAAVEARRLRAGAGEPALRRRDLLDDLASRLEALCRTLIDQSAEQAAVLGPLRDLIAVLGDGGIPLEERWNRALTVLDDVAARQSASEPAQPGPAKPQRAFWKRGQ